MAAPTPSSAHSAPPSTSPAPASAGAQYPAPSPVALEGMVPGMFPPPPAYPTFTHNGVNYVYIPVPVAFLPAQTAQTHVTSRKRKRPAVPPPCTLCRLSRTPCVAARPGEACARCIRKQVECFDDGDTTDTARLRHPPEDDGPEDVDSEPERDPNQPWQISANGYPPSYVPPPPSYPPTTASTPIKRERATKACAECHARKRKCTGIGGPNCGSTGSRPTPANGAPSGSGARPSPRKSTPGGASGHTRVREPCADCRGRKRRCIHHSDPNAPKDDGANGTDVDAAGDESMRTDHEGDSLQPQMTGRTSHRISHPGSRSPPRGSQSPPPNSRWQPHPPSSYYSQPPPQFSYPHAEHRVSYPHPGQGQFIHPSHGHENPYSHPPPPPHGHGMHPHQPHPRLPPAPDMRHGNVPGPGCKDCRARGVTCTCPDTRAVDAGSNAGSASSVHTAAPSGPAPPTKGATPVPATTPAPPAGRKGRACLACRKLKMRCVAPSNANGDNANANNPDGPDERCQRCERAGLECIYVDRKRRGPGTVFGGPGEGTGSFEGYTQQANPNGGGANGAPVVEGNANGNGSGNGTPARPPAKKLKREISPGAGGAQTGRNSPFPAGTAVPAGAGGDRRRSGDDALMQLVSGDDSRMSRVMGEDAARTLEESFADDDDEGAGGR